MITATLRLRSHAWVFHLEFNSFDAPESEFKNDDKLLNLVRKWLRWLALEFVSKEPKVSKGVAVTAYSSALVPYEAVFSPRSKPGWLFSQRSQTVSKPLIYEISSVVACGDFANA